MASNQSLRKLLQNSAVLKRGAEIARQDVFGHLPQLNTQSGHRLAKKSFTGPYLERYYPEPIGTYARKVFPGWESEEEEYRRVKLTQRRRKGKGPPQKGSGSRSSKKKR
eukprot:Nitzschia sp. Nitz4//scaffold86_size83305//46923//47328//NITZ4_005262-RA/size83305-snap-gene-0.169-mRNA-1//-1//CDS//3329559250//1672//frame0